MKRKLLTMGVALLCTYFSAMAQTEDIQEEKPQNLVSHKVEMGETVMLIAKKYRIKPEDIYDYNPKAVDGISYNTILQIPADKRYAAKTKPKKNIAVANYTTAHQTTSVPKD